jgi:hypothetical protein
MRHFLISFLVKICRFFSFREILFTAVENSSPGLANTTKYLYIEYHSVRPLVDLGLPQPLSRKQVCPPPPPGPKGGGGAPPLRLEVGESQFRRLEKKLSPLPTLWPTLLQWIERLT